ncbi:MAG: hypothetical protein RBT60_00845 [Candidatus Krumholzibacteria bacterium]|jgi:hypothetical protein|nr:hypothetical protein [Candidatus Krumholzibacteria bacterium]
MRKHYSKPELRCQIVKLGVFGNYDGGGGNDGDGGSDTPTPIRVIEGFRLHMD